MTTGGDCEGPDRGRPTPVLVVAAVDVSALVMATLVVPAVLAVLRVDSVVELIGAGGIHSNVHRAAVTHLAHTQ